MAERIEIVDVTIPAGTLLAAPITVPLNVNDGVWTRLQMRWPPGPSGLVGLRIAQSGQVMIPSKGNAFLVTDDEVVDWDLHGYPTGNKWSVVGYNTDVYNHTIQFRILLDEIASAQQTAVSLVPISAV